ncbi:glycoside hydrolase family 88/105 protein [Clostridium estertheticum]|uniref:glycoside hydrolase family 88/105 protein n=1 Tax=Clostridium estertheticum TaxID=238834 RepID=UPI001C0AFF7B|nr:glycoside hydrolase family 88 protein [Clostridium estertheticum]MBU3072205.1 glycoside hydrolase family 88 protein [Clostridium estertheticum]MBU3162297.1 glycoside hydrolase family 88 protein [Clostridium estertheticum]MBU3170728.1 glycoside hydrolase family 88 protein [Clostridium estertheticum]MBX4261473.1 glycoside hydrolase family 88 protein [Clostridium estertheticum]MCB2339372.1 glycoside hydrolase family 88 protein [Clostridium estertheticum]
MENWAARMTDSVMIRTPEFNCKWEYDNGVIFKGIELLWKITKDKKYFDFIKKNMDFFIDETGDIKKYSVTEYNIDHVNNGKLLFLLYKETGLEKYKKAAFLLREQLRNHPRTSEGAFWHKQIYPYQIWLDGLYMGSPFFAEFIKEFGETSEFDDVTKQFLICERHAKDSVTGLLYHAWDEKKVQPWCNKETGLSKNFWGRSMGWYVMAIVDVLDYLPENHKDRARIIEILNEVLEALLKVRDEKTGLWYQVLDKGTQKGNYIESSASCMILYAIAKGSNKGYIPKKWVAIAKTTYKNIVDEFIMVTKDGLVNLNKTCAVAGLGGATKRDGTYEYYISEPIVTNDAKGIGAFILAAAEMEILN